MSGSEGEEEEYKEIESLLSSDKKDPLTRAKKAVYKLVKKVGFFGILLSASVSVLGVVQVPLDQDWLDSLLNDTGT